MLNSSIPFYKMQKYKDALELDALKDDKTQDQLHKDNQDLLQKIEVCALVIHSRASLSSSFIYCSLFTESSTY